MDAEEFENRNKMKKKFFSLMKFQTKKNLIQKVKGKER